MLMRWSVLGVIFVSLQISIWHVQALSFNTPNYHFKFGKWPLLEITQKSRPPRNKPSLRSDTIMKSPSKMTAVQNVPVVSVKKKPLVMFYKPPRGVKPPSHFVVADSSSVTRHANKISTNPISNTASNNFVNVLNNGGNRRVGNARYFVSPVPTKKSILTSSWVHQPPKLRSDINQDLLKQYNLLAVPMKPGHERSAFQAIQKPVEVIQTTQRRVSHGHERARRRPTSFLRTPRFRPFRASRPPMSYEVPKQAPSQYNGPSLNLHSMNQGQYQSYGLGHNELRTQNNYNGNNNNHNGGNYNPIRGESLRNLEVVQVNTDFQDRHTHSPNLRPQIPPLITVGGVAPENYTIPEAYREITRIMLPPLNARHPDKIIETHGISYDQPSGFYVQKNIMLGPGVRIGGHHRVGAPLNQVSKLDMSLRRDNRQASSILQKSIRNILPVTKVRGRGAMTPFPVLGKQPLSRLEGHMNKPLDSIRRQVHHNPSPLQIKPMASNVWPKVTKPKRVNSVPNYEDVGAFITKTEIIRSPNISAPLDGLSSPAFQAALAEKRRVDLLRQRKRGSPLDRQVRLLGKLFTQLQKISPTKKTKTESTMGWSATYNKPHEVPDPYKKMVDAPVVVMDLQSYSVPEAGSRDPAILDAYKYFGLPGHQFEFGNSDQLIRLMSDAIVNSRKVNLYKYGNNPEEMMTNIHNRVRSAVNLARRLHDDSHARGAEIAPRYFRQYQFFVRRPGDGWGKPQEYDPKMFNSAGTIVSGGGAMQL